MRGRKKYIYQILYGAYICVYNEEDNQISTNHVVVSVISTGKAKLFMSEVEVVSHLNVGRFLSDLREYLETYCTASNERISLGMFKVCLNSLI